MTHLPTRKKLIIMSGALIGLFLAALDQTIVGTALPKIVAELGGISSYNWVVTLYLLTSTAAVPIFGKLSDIYGRKPFLLFGVITFVAGSMLAGLSQDIVQLIIFRGIQGIGAAALMGNTFTVVADLFPPSERGKWMGLVGATFGLSSVIGPLVGGFITDNFSWRWNFYVNFPIGVIAFIMLMLTMPSARNVVKKAVDYVGSTLLVAVLVCLLLALTWGGSTYEWNSVQIIGLFAGAAIALGLFLYTESKVEDPIIPLDLFKDSIVSVSLAVVFLSGVAMFAAIVYIPLFAQVVQGQTATNSGLIVIPFVLGMVVASIMAGQLISRLGHYKIFGIVGTFILGAGLFLLSMINVDTSNSTFVLYMIIPGFGLGLGFPTFNLAVQNAVPHHRLGVATSSLQLFRSMGATLGLAVLGGIFNSRLPENIKDATDPVTASALPPQVTQALSDPQVIAASPEAGQKMIEQAIAGIPNLPPEQLGAIKQAVVQLKEAVKTGMAETIAYDFFVAMLFVAVALALTFFLKNAPLRTQNVEQSRNGSSPGPAADIPVEIDLTKGSEEGR